MGNMTHVTQAEMTSAAHHAIRLGCLTAVQPRASPCGLRIGSALTASGNYSWFLTGDVAEVLVYPSALSATDRQAVENYLMNKWLASYTQLGDLNLAPGARLILNSKSGGPGTAGFTSITSGNGATIDGNVAVTQLLDPTGKLTISGDLEASTGMVYKFDLTTDPVKDLVESSTLHFDSTFTLQLFGSGASIKPSDTLTLFQFDTLNGLYINGVPFNGGTNPLQALIQCTVEDPSRTYVWDTSNAQLLVDDHNIYLTGLKAEMVPEPATLALLGLGTLALLRRRRARKA